MKLYTCLVEVCSRLLGRGLQPTPRRCGNCAWWWEYDPEFGMGECRKNPPAMLDTNDGQFPKVSDIRWCGEWVDAEAK